ncbi:pancreatic secretory granule membrane major glycoprotein GP2-like isoform X2 [Ambystoma mexicanum]|uniref:pancreatic secretory granule membrane major glycoprotein GP2-like isoform X2 n=1 Tax=Ambystoma mexicanum TaxID=8296 RepID=UPI0037E8F719
MTPLRTLLLAALLGEAGAQLCGGHPSNLPACDACDGDCLAGIGCLCATGNFSVCLPDTCRMTSMCCPDGLYWHADERCCSDVPVCYPACMDDERCELPQAECQCNPSKHNGANISQVAPILRCEPSLMIITVPKCLLEKLGYNPDGMHVRNSSVECRNMYTDFINGTRVYSNQILTFGGTCGNAVTVNGTHVTYANILQIPAKTVGVVKVFNLTYHFSCSYLLTMQAALDIAVNPIMSTVSIALGGADGAANVTMAAFWDTSYTQPMTSMQEVPVGTAFYFGLVTDFQDNDTFALRAETCFATPINDANSQKRVQLITGGCSADKGVITQVKENGVNLQVLFSSEAFAFQGFSQVFVFCDARLCQRAKENCQQICQDQIQIRPSLQVSPGWRCGAHCWRCC